MVHSDHQSFTLNVDPVGVSERGGSSGRGTALRGSCDSELVIFLNCFKSYADHGAHSAEILNEMRAQLESWWMAPIPGLSLEFPKQDTPFLALLFRLVASEDPEIWMDVRLVPAFDALGQLSSGVKPKPQVYSTLVNSGCRQGEYAACFTELRRDFVNTRPAKLKNLILLVKHWYYQVRIPLETLPPVYALELLTIFAWEQGCGKDAFSLAQGLRTVLGLIHQYQHLCVFWTVYYDFEDPTVGQFLRDQLKKPRPVILDPADPTWDVGNGAARQWDMLAQEAGSCYSHPCFLQVPGSPVQPWEGPIYNQRFLCMCPVEHREEKVEKDPDQRTPEDSGNLSAVHSRAGSGQPSHPAPSPSGMASNAPSMPGTVSDLSQIPSKELDRFIQNHLKPSPKFQELMSKAIDSILRCLRENCIHKVSRISKLKILYSSQSTAVPSLEDWAWFVYHLHELPYATLAP
ncbi:PREDICTED: 2'-5'-oligoadenylate synthase 3-like [Chrysochloris asiatica]|uniref:2'-5'-oligoadenylate synthase 3-like n=1 Tax=Chrysochloris asiatica TaxID=185453 RepID=A0A9B0WX78_CHRAS|nr:PREDICTED: 2'-5'-oligoadenylate synthase 3-like [Chrysochloris asiatica]